MGMYDNIIVDESFGLPGLARYPEKGWQTKSLGCALELYRIDESGKLHHTEHEYEEAPEEERPGYDEDIGGFKHDFERLWGSRRVVDEEEEEYPYTGELVFYQSAPVDSVEGEEDVELEAEVANEDTEHEREYIWVEYTALYENGEILYLEREF